MMYHQLRRLLLNSWSIHQNRCAHNMPVPLSNIFCRRLSTFLGGSQSTIYALATGGIRCALAVVRISGPCSSEILREMGKFSESLPSIEPRKALLRKLHDPRCGKVIDHGLVLWFPAPRSFTGEDVCELHIHGGPAVVTKILETIGSFPGCRMAEPGEFSKRAFLNGKMDLTAVEGLGDLISAETEMQRAQALNQMSGSLGSLYESWRDKIAKCLANAEAFIDFGEDENIESDVLEKVDDEILRMLEEMTTHLGDQRKGEILRDGVRVAILGSPNVGKSSLLNIISKRDVAIVSNVPGTTRDVVESCIDFKGYPIIFADTAGIRVSPNEIEKEGIRRALLAARNANVVLLVISFEDACERIKSLLDLRDGLQVENDLQQIRLEIIKAELTKLLSVKLEEQDASNCIESKELISKVMIVVNKMDLGLTQTNTLLADVTAKLMEKIKLFFDATISCKTLSGVNNLTESLVQMAAKICHDPSIESPCLTRERHRSHLQNCILSLKNYLNPENFNEHDLALRVQNLKLAMNNIGYITGHLGTEDILDIIFKDFCIGK